MKILALCFFFKPDLSAGSFRATSVIDALRERMPESGHIDVLTTRPNRYSSFSVEAPLQEQLPGVSITRIALPGHSSGMLDQARAYATFARQVLRHVRGREYDLVFVTSGRLMTSVLGAWIARRRHIPYYLDIRDIFVDTIKDVLPRHWAVVLKPFFSVLERFAVTTATQVNLISRGFAEYFKNRYPNKEFTYITNGIDDEFMSEKALPVPQREDGRVEVVYAGNFGEGQGLHAIMPALAKRMRRQVVFKIVGDGGRRQALLDALAKEGVDNVEVLPPISRDRLVEVYRTADVLFLHLNDYDAFEKVLPSKIFEYGAMGKPIWAGVAGYAARFVDEELDNAEVFPPCDVEAAEQAFARLSLKPTPRTAFVAKFGRARLAQQMADAVLALAGRQP
ncbi:MAG: glycosyltransferase WbuB [Alphaproteobacteria bacterium CG_4_10_14_0_2_um_filter_63_37]|nr:MAG: glycosyltransferase WbuB [Proteobacteria bacterium CG1_02_64_396]PJA24538.1 MAG: glycosyltransferase WbuB [Alphaproteobacteria bacterium CG_4_10_14_0_2_um_filter_63_37]